MITPGNKKPRATVEALLARRDKGPAKSVWVDLEGMGLALEVRRLPLARYWSLTAGAPGDPDALLQAQNQLIYEFCPMLRDEQIQAGYGLDRNADPADIVPLVFGDNLADMLTVVTAINDLYGAESGIDGLKN